MSEHLTVIWRPYFDDYAIGKMTEMGTLPRNETVIDSCYDNGPDVAAEVARVDHSFDSDSFTKGGDIVILEPAQFAGRYAITTDWEPTFSAELVEDIDELSNVIEKPMDDEVAEAIDRRWEFT
jgi:hypothetical protein